MNKSLWAVLALIVSGFCLLAGCLQLDPEEQPAPELRIFQNGGQVRVIDIDPDEEILLSIMDNSADVQLAASASSSSGAITALKSDLDYIVKGVIPGGMGVISFSAMNKTGEVRVFVRNWKKADVYRHTMYADLVQYPYDGADDDTGYHVTAPNRWAAYRLIVQAGFHYEAPDGLSSRHSGSKAAGNYIPPQIHGDTPRLDGHNLHRDMSEPPHITQELNSWLQKDVFSFHLHYADGKGRDNDGDMVGGYRDRQRLELKTMDTGAFKEDDGTENDSRDMMYSNGGGDRFTHRWKFRLPEDFKASTEYVHLHQIKPEGGDSGNPTITLTARIKSNGRKVMQLIYRGPIRDNGDPSQNTYPCEVDLADFLGEWVRAEETVTYDNPGSYRFKLVRIRDMKVLMEYIYFPQNYDEVDPFVMFRTGNSYIRPKFGIYRRILHMTPFGIPDDNNPIKGLKDEEVLFADFEMDKWVN